MSNITTFIDHIGRTLVGELVEENDTHIVVKNPAIIHVQPTQTGQLNVQTIPLYFREFISDKNKNDGTSWKFNKATIVQGVNIENDGRLVDQYNRLFAAAPVVTDDQKVIKLFDE
ncbi:hypothetical protein EB118_03360 [bacterium]|nr:hypothetical protein [bacterium]